MTAATDFPDDVGRALVALARKTIVEHLGLQFPTADTASLTEVLQRPAAAERHGVFVTLTINGHLRGCIGTLTAEGSVIEGITRHAINAAFHDPRFSPLTREELAHVSIEVSILSEPCALSYTGSADLLARLRPGIDGVILSSGYRSATFLPQVWAQLPEPAGFLSHLCLKAGLTPDFWQTSTLGIMTYQVQHFSDAHR